MPRVMISYRNVDGQREFATYLQRELAKAGLDTWIDVNDIPKLSRWEDEIFGAIIESDFVVICLSPQYLESEACLFECYVARGYSKFLLPVIVPHAGEESVFTLVSQFEATRGLDHLEILDFKSQSIMGLQQSVEELLQHLIKGMTNPTPPDAAYDVYFSFRWKHAAFATRVADDLNRAGIKSFVHTRAIDVGTTWRQVSWSAILRSKIHIVILSPDIAQSEYINNELLVTRTKDDERYIPIVPEEFMDDAAARTSIRQACATSKNLSPLNDIQWLMPTQGYAALLEDLKAYIETVLN